MPDLPKKKVGLIACSGEELAEGTVTRLAALKVLEQLRPVDTVTICLPLFLAGGEGDRAFARFYPTIAIDGCDKRCAARATGQFSGKPAASVVVSDLVREHGLGRPEGKRRLNENGLQAVDLTANQVVGLVDELLAKTWSRRTGEVVESKSETGPEEIVQAACSCQSNIPIQKVAINDQTVSLVALPLIFEQFRAAGKTPGDGTAKELLDVVKIYNEVPAGADESYAAALARDYAVYCDQKETST